MLSSPQFPASMSVNPNHRSGLITQCLGAVRQQVAEAAVRHGRDLAEVHLLAVSKQQPPSAIAEAAAAGQRDFGENYLQEAVSKIEACKLLGGSLELTWHFIGQLQSNKTRLVAENFDWAHTVDRDKLAQRLNDQRPHEAKPLQVCIQVKLAKEETKGGIAAGEALALAKYIIKLPRLTLRGLMCIPPVSDSVEQQRHYFAQLALLKQQLNQQLVTDSVHLDTLSMGMSHDYDAAIAEGATIVRIGTAIFGQRI
jgi:pyridoxal phosphate enzyme (YggS family)